MLTERSRRQTRHLDNHHDFLETTLRSPFWARAVQTVKSELSRIDRYDVAGFTRMDEHLAGWLFETFAYQRVQQAGLLDPTQTAQFFQEHVFPDAKPVNNLFGLTGLAGRHIPDGLRIGESPGRPAVFEVYEYTAGPNAINYFNRRPETAYKRLIRLYRTLKSGHPRLFSNVGLTIVIPDEIELPRVRGVKVVKVAGLNTTGLTFLKNELLEEARKI